MKKLVLILAGFTLSTGLFAGEAKEVTLEGTGMCAKCELGSSDKCLNVLQVGKGDKAKTYTFAKNVKHGDYFCQGTTAVLVVKGKVEMVDGKIILTASSVEKKES